MLIEKKHLMLFFILLFCNLSTNIFSLKKPKKPQVLYDHLTKFGRKNRSTLKEELFTLMVTHNYFSIDRHNIFHLPKFLKEDEQQELLQELINYQTSLLSPRTSLSLFIDTIQGQCSQCEKNFNEASDYQHFALLDCARCNTHFTCPSVYLEHKAEHEYEDSSKKTKRKVQSRSKQRKRKQKRKRSIAQEVAEQPIDDQKNQENDHLAPVDDQPKMYHASEPPPEPQSPIPALSPLPDNPDFL